MLSNNCYAFGEELVIFLVFCHKLHSFLILTLLLQGRAYLDQHGPAVTRAGFGGGSRLSHCPPASLACGFQPSGLLCVTSASSDELEGLVPAALRLEARVLPELPGPSMLTASVLMLFFLECVHFIQLCNSVGIKLIRIFRCWSRATSQ